MAVAIKLFQSRSLVHERVFVVMNVGVRVVIFEVVDVGAEQVVLKLSLLLCRRMARVIVLSV